LRRKQREGVNKTELIEEIAQRTDSSKGETQKYMESFEGVRGLPLRNGLGLQLYGAPKVRGGFS
jgi:nucleoid DNA-binding protein